MGGGAFGVAAPLFRPVPKRFQAVGTKPREAAIRRKAKRAAAATRLIERLENPDPRLSIVQAEQVKAMAAKMHEMIATKGLDSREVSVASRNMKRILNMTAALETHINETIVAAARVEVEAERVKVERIKANQQPQQAGTIINAHAQYFANGDRRTSPPLPQPGREALEAIIDENERGAG